MVRCDFQHCNKNKNKSQTPWLCFTKPPEVPGSHSENHGVAPIQHRLYL